MHNSYPVLSFACARQLSEGLAFIALQLLVAITSSTGNPLNYKNNIIDT
jgi:hypothetical protein